MSSAGESSPGAAGAPEERLPGYQGGQSSGDSEPTPADTAPDRSETAGESDNLGGYTPGDTGDTPGDSSQSELTGAGESSGAGPGAAAPADRAYVAPVPEGQRVRDYDWPRIKARYVEGVADTAQGITVWPSLNEVAAYYERPANRIREKAAQEGWVEERNRYQAQVEATRRQAKAAAMSREATALDGRALDAAKAGLQLCHLKLVDLTRRAQASRAENVGDPGAARIELDAQEMQRLAQAVDLFHKIGLRAVGDPETHRLEITGAGGRPIEIAQELKRDDPARLTGVLAVLRQAGLGDLFGGSGDPGRAALGDGRADGGEPAALPGG